MNFTHFAQIRRDGKVILSNTDLLSLGWEACRIQKVQWETEDGKIISFESNFGLIANIVGDRRHVVINFALDEEWHDQRVSVFDSQGILKFDLPREHLIFNSVQRGVYLWWDGSAEGSTLFNIIFETPSGQWRLTIDSDTNKCISYSEAR